VNRSIRQVAVVLLGLFLVLFVQLNRVQVLDAESLREHPANTRAVFRDFARPRGPITTADGVVVARSVAVSGPLERLREYPLGERYAHITGYLSLNVGSTGIERSYNDELTGRTSGQQLDRILDLFGADQDFTGEVVLTVRDDLQQAAQEALGQQLGSVVALDPRSGAVLASWSYPSYDPNRLSAHDGNAVNAAFAELQAASGTPLLEKAYREIYFPGSTFKVVTAAAGLGSGEITPTFPVFEQLDAYTPPLTTRPIRNFGGATCGGDLDELLRVSCNTGFAEMAAELLGPDPMVATAEDFGFNEAPPLDVPATAASRFPTDFGERLEAPTPEIPAGVYENTPTLAQAAIGQNDVAASPLHMAMVAGAIANDGVMMQPHLVGEVLDRTGDSIRSIDPESWRTATSPEVAADLRSSMIGVVQDGTARRLAVDGLEIGGKTGTAQLGTDPPSSHAWIVAFAGRPGAEPELAVAVLVQAQPGASEQTGGSVAAPIARAVIERYFAS
jgi:peptidoglycan glycosyltransferase